jgi:hypothetical protein
MTEGCVFCDHDSMREADLYFENEFCIYASTRDPVIRLTYCLGTAA